MKKIFITLGLALVLLVPAFGQAESESLETLQAQVEQLLAQVKMLQEKLASLSVETAYTPTAPSKNVNPNICLFLSRNMQVGSSDQATNGEVSKLQSYLRTTGDYKLAEITGYYGLVTEQAVKSLQAREGIVSSGTAASTGYGAVGPATRAKVNCGYVNPLPPTPILKPAPTDPLPLPFPDEKLNFSASPVSGSVPLTVHFSKVSEGSRDLDYEVNFGDGSTGRFSSVSGLCVEGATGACEGPTNIQLSHVYQKAGTYTATLERLYRCEAGPGMNCIDLYSTQVGSVTITVK